MYAIRSYYEHHLVLDITVKEGTERHDHEKSVRMAGLKASDYIARSVLNHPLPAGSRETLINPEYPGSPGSPKRAVRNGKPRIAYLVITSYSIHYTKLYDACFLDPFQGPVLANFITQEFKFKKAAVLYDVASDYPKGLAEFFRMAWERLHGPGSVVAYESFTTKDTSYNFV